MTKIPAAREAMGLEVANFEVPSWIRFILPPTTAVRSTTLALPGLARNAVIRTLDVRLTAAPADQTPLAVAQVRTNPGRGNLVNVVIDFGTLVTVSGIDVELGSQDALGVYQVQAWNGSTFAFRFHNTPLSGVSSPGEGNFGPDKLQPVAPSSRNRTVFENEVRTEKLQIVVVTTLSDNQLVEKLVLHLPDAPSGLELTTDTGLRLFNQVPTVVPLGATELTDNDWNLDWQRVVHLAPLLAPLAGDPVAHDALPITLTLASRVPGVLVLAEAARDVAWLERLPLGPDGARDLTFAEEGLATFPLPLGTPYHAVVHAKLTAVGKPGPARVLPPLGPTPIPDIDLMMTPELVMACRVPVAELASLTGVRLALAAGPEGAEVKIVVLADDNGEPGAAIDGAESVPVTLPPGTTAASAPWTTFALQGPLDLAHTPSPWIAILVSRGKLAWSMGQYASAALAVPVRRGPPLGPWVRLPSMFQRATGFLDRHGQPLDLSRLGARIRAIGLAPANTPIAPFRIAITASDSPALGAAGGVPVTPTAKGAAIEWAPAVTLTNTSQLTVQVVSLVADTVTLRNLDVTLTK